MKSIVLVPALLFAVACFAADDTKAPQVSTLVPKVAKPGDTIVVTGVSLSEDRVDEVYLTDHKFDMKVKVLEQSDTTIKMRIPPFAKPGRMQLLILTKATKADDDPKLLEQPVYVLIEENSTQIGQVQQQEGSEKPKQR